MIGDAAKEEEKIGFSPPPMANQSGHEGEGIGQKVFPPPDQR
jgi:hypothetical protein